MQNIKVDIAYYMTATDFEMEFNLCGCCRTRLLTDRSTDKKSFINIMSRAVSRSRVIIGCGKLFGKDGMISLVAAAIGKKTTIADKNEYGINAENEIPIIEGSIPLVTADGYFGGCIIESGPQTMVLLTENKTIRKNIMQTLIHPYLEELSLIPTENTADAEPDKEVVNKDESNEETAPVIAPDIAPDIAQEISSEIVPETAVEIPEEDNEEIETEPIEEPETITEETAEETNDETHIEETQETSEEPKDISETVLSEILNETDMPSYDETYTMHNQAENYVNGIDDTEDDSYNMTFITDSNDDFSNAIEQTEDEGFLENLYIEKGKIVKKRDIRERHSDYYIQSEEDSLFVSQDEDTESISRRHIEKKHKSNTPIIIILAILLIVVGVLVFTLIITPILRNETPLSYIQSLFNTAFENQV